MIVVEGTLYPIDAAEECGPAHLPVGRVPAGTAPQVLFPYGQGAGVPGFAG